MGSETELLRRKAKERAKGKESNTVGDFKILQYARRKKIAIGIAFYEVTRNKIERITGGTKSYARTGVCVCVCVSHVDLESVYRQKPRKTCLPINRIDTKRHCN